MLVRKKIPWRDSERNPDVNHGLIPDQYLLEQRLYPGYPYPDDECWYEPQENEEEPEVPEQIHEPILEFLEIPQINDIGPDDEFVPPM